MADIAARSLALVDGWGAGYRPTGSPVSPRYTVAKSIKDNGNGTATITLTVTVKTNSGYIGGGWILTLHFSVAGVQTSKVWKASSGNWVANSTYSTSIAVTIPLDGVTVKTADLWLTATEWDVSKTPFTWRASAQGGDQITGVPVGYRVSTFNSFGNFNSTASTISCSVTRNTASLTNRMTLKLGGTTIQQWTGLGSFTELALSAAATNAIHNALPNATSATVTMLMETLNGSTVVGSATKTATVSIPSSIVPGIGSFTHSENEPSVASIVGAYVQSLSRIRFEMSAWAGAYSTITSTRIEFAGQSWTTATATTGAISQSGNLIAKATVTDARGRTATKEVTIPVLAYTPPKLTTATVQRANSAGTAQATGTWLRINHVGTVASLINGTERNSLTLTVQRKLKTDSVWTTVKTVTGGTSITGFSVSDGTYLQGSSYDVRITLADKFGSVEANRDVLTIKVAFSIGRNEGIGAGKQWERGALDIGGDVYHNGTKVDLAAAADFGTNNIRFFNYADGTTIDWREQLKAKWSELPSNAVLLLRLINNSETGTVLAMKTSNENGRAFGMSTNHGFVKCSLLSSVWTMTEL